VEAKQVHWTLHSEKEDCYVTITDGNNTIVMTLEDVEEMFNELVDYQENGQ
jgi:hypothetical protein